MILEGPDACWGVVLQSIGCHRNSIVTADPSATVGLSGRESFCFPEPPYAFL